MTIDFLMQDLESRADRCASSSEAEHIRADAELLFSQLDLLGVIFEDGEFLQNFRDEVAQRKERVQKVAEKMESINAGR